MVPPMKSPAQAIYEAVAAPPVSTVAPARTRPRDATKKPSYVLQRQEQQLLATQLRVLDAQLNQLRVRAGLPSQADKAAVDAVRAQSATLKESIYVNDSYMARLQSQVTNELLLPPVNTLSSFIHLPRDMAQRRAILLGLQSSKLRRGIDVALNTLYHLDHTQPYVSEERFQTEGGEYHYNRYEIDQFPNFQTARQLYDAYVRFLYNMEINLTEMLDQLTLREDADDIADATIWNHRFVTVSEDVGVPEELNLVGFAHFYNHSPHTNSPMGVIVYDTVNVDELYPYQPDDRTCKDIQAAKMVLEIRKPGSNETVVVLKQVRFSVQLPPQFDVALHVRDQLHKNFSTWPNAIVKYLHAYNVVPASLGWTQM